MFDLIPNTFTNCGATEQQQCKRLQVLHRGFIKHKPVALRVLTNGVCAGCFRVCDIHDGMPEAASSCLSLPLPCGRCPHKINS